MTDAGLKELARTDTALKGLTELYLPIRPEKGKGLEELRSKVGLTVHD